MDSEADQLLLSSPSKDGQSVAIATATVSGKTSMSFSTVIKLSLYVCVCVCKKEDVPLCQLSSSNLTKGTAADSDQKPLIEAEVNISLYMLCIWMIFVPLHIHVE